MRLVYNNTMYESVQLLPDEIREEHLILRNHGLEIFKILKVFDIEGYAEENMTDIEVFKPLPFFKLGHHQNLIKVSFQDVNNVLIVYHIMHTDLDTLHGAIYDYAKKNKKSTAIYKDPNHSIYVHLRCLHHNKEEERS